MTTHLIKPGCDIRDLRMRCGRSTTEANGDRLGSEDAIDFVDCTGCLRDLIADLRLEKLGNTAETRWLVSGDVGISSKTIWTVMTGWPIEGHQPRTPWDPDDFGRCHRLLETFPAWRSRMPEVADAHPEWADLVVAWDELTALYLEELPSGQAPRLYARMEALR
jgi:hypothetical protein